MLSCSGSTSQVSSPRPRCRSRLMTRFRSAIFKASQKALQAYFSLLSDSLSSKFSFFLFFFILFRISTVSALMRNKQKHLSFRPKLQNFCCRSRLSSRWQKFNSIYFCKRCEISAIFGPNDFLTSTTDSSPLAIMVIKEQYNNLLAS